LNIPFSLLGPSTENVDVPFPSTAASLNYPPLIHARYHKHTPSWLWSPTAATPPADRTIEATQLRRAFWIGGYQQHNSGTQTTSLAFILPPILTLTVFSWMDRCTVLVFRQISGLEDAIGSHAWWFGFGSMRMSITFFCSVVCSFDDGTTLKGILTARVQRQLDGQEQTCVDERAGERTILLLV
jgi:hypothetical protein